MIGDRIALALARIEAASARIETAANAPVSHVSLADEELKAKVSQVLTELDRVIQELER